MGALTGLSSMTGLSGMAGGGGGGGGAEPSFSAIAADDNIQEGAVASSRDPGTISYAGASALRYQITSSNSIMVIVMPSSSGATIAGNGSHSVTITGALAEINQELAGCAIEAPPPMSAAGAVTFTQGIRRNGQGSDAATDATWQLTVIPAEPTIGGMPGATNYGDDQAFTISLGGAPSIDYNGADTLEARIEATNTSVFNIMMNAGTGLTFSVGSVSTPASAVQFSGSVSDVLSALANSIGGAAPLNCGSGGAIVKIRRFGQGSWNDTDSVDIDIVPADITAFDAVPGAGDPTTEIDCTSTSTSPYTDSYRIQYKETSSGTWLLHPDSPIAPASVYAFTLGSFDPGTAYDVRIRGEHSGSGFTSGWIEDDATTDP